MPDLISAEKREIRRMVARMQALAFEAADPANTAFDAATEALALHHAAGTLRRVFGEEPAEPAPAGCGEG